MTKKTDDSFRDALLELAVAKPVPDKEALEEAIRLHPEHAAELAAAAVDLAVLARGDDGAEDAIDEGPVHPSVARAMARFEARRAELAENPFAALDKEALRGLGKTLGASTVLVLKLRDRTIRAETIPASFVERVAAAMQIAVEAVRAHLAKPPVVAAGAFFKAEARPAAGAQQTFEEAVRSSGLKEAEIERLLE